MIRPASMVALAVALFTAAPLHAQHRAGVFVHGFGSTSRTWEDAMARLGSQLSLTGLRPAIRSRETFETQAQELEHQAGVTVMPVVIGHSNGGLASRQWNRTHPMSGLLTLSTPNRGAPIATNAKAYLDYNVGLVQAVWMVDRTFLDRSEGTPWVYDVIGGALSFVNHATSDAIIALAMGAYGAVTPVNAQNRVGSDFLRDINSNANLAREARDVPRRAAIVTAVSDYHLGGPARAISPTLGNVYRVGLYAAIGTLDYWAMTIASSGHIRDQERAQAMLTVSFMLSLHENFWCQAVSDPTPFAVSFGGSCHPNDTFIPSWSHEWPGAVNIPVGNAPTHVEQTEKMTPVLFDVLTNHLGVPQRGPDGNPSTSSVLLPRETLRPGGGLTAPNGQYRVIYQPDGNLVVYRADNSAVWSSATSGTSPNVAWMQSDGNFVLYDPVGAPIWHTHTYGNPGAYLSLQNNGSLVVYSASTGLRLWGTPIDPRYVGPDGGTGGGGPDTLTAGARIYPGQAVRSGDGRFALTYQSDGNLVLYGPGGVPRWSTQTFSIPGYAEMQHDGNFVVYASNGVPLWASGTSGQVNARLVVHSDGNVVIYASNGLATWATHTGGS
jgi:pimeloyl-ACP methyl ester carboxylesterase